MSDSCVTLHSFVTAARTAAGELISCWLAKQTIESRFSYRLCVRYKVFNHLNLERQVITPSRKARKEKRFFVGLRPNESFPFLYMRIQKRKSAVLGVLAPLREIIIFSLFDYRNKLQAKLAKFAKKGKHSSPSANARFSWPSWRATMLFSLLNIKGDASRQNAKRA